MPADVVTYVRYFLANLLGVVAVGVETPTARIICNYVAAQMAAGPGRGSVPILFTGGVSAALVRHSQAE